MTTETLSPVPVQRFYDNGGNPLVGGKLFTYQAGTTTKQSTFTDSTGGTPNANPTILDYRGEARIWIPPNVAYKYVLAPSTDTDPPTAPIWSVDQLVNSQLITLYGGVDTGSINAYILTFVANFSSYVDGTIIYWIPSHANTGPSTINVNGLGVITITNQDGTALSSGQLQQNQTAEIMFKGGSFLLLATGNVPLSGSFTASLTGFASTPSPVVNYWIVGRLCMLRSGTTLATSNSTSMTMTGLPAAVTPVSGASAVACVLQDNSASVGGWATVNAGTGTITFGNGFNNNQTGFTAAGNKGLNAGWCMSYPLG